MKRTIDESQKNQTTNNKRRNTMKSLFATIATAFVLASLFIAPAPASADYDDYFAPMSVPYFSGNMKLSYASKQPQNAELTVTPIVGLDPLTLDFPLSQNRDGSYKGTTPATYYGWSLEYHLWLFRWGNHVFVRILTSFHGGIVDDRSEIFVFSYSKPVTQDRFTDNGDGTVTDNKTGLVWLEDANCFDFSHNWNDAMSLAASLKKGMCGLTDGSSAGDWRLPTKTEWENFVCKQYTNLAMCNTVGTGQWTEGNPFTNVQYDYKYWSSTVSGSSWAFYVNLYNGNMYTYQKSNENYVWPVRNP